MLKRFTRKLKEPSRYLVRSAALETEIKFLSSQQAIQSMQPSVQRLLAYEFQLGELASRLCPVLLADQSIALFTVQEYSNSDALYALADQVQQQGYVLATPARYVLSLTLLLELIRDPELNLGSLDILGVSATAPWSQADLFDAFLDIVRWGVQHQASDIHLNVFSEKQVSEVRFSVAGRYIFPAKFQGISTQFLQDMLSVAWMSIRGGNGAVFDPHKEQQGSLSCQIDGQEIMLRWGALAAELGPSICLRILQRDRRQILPTLSQLGYLPDQRSLLEQAALSDGGAIIFSGAVGSGKSTTLAALVGALPSWRKVISLEDPVEYLIPHAVQVSLSRDLNHEAHDAFATKLRALKRSAMSDVLLGEIRDVETGRAFTDLSSSGVRLYTTVHANSATQVPLRLNSDFIGVSLDLLAAPGVIRLIVHQCLLPKLCQHCALPLSSLAYFPETYDAPLDAYSWAEWLQRLQQLVGRAALKKIKIRNVQGCHFCLKDELHELAGWDGRIVCAEILDPFEHPHFLKNLRQQADSLKNSPQRGWMDIRSNALRQSVLGYLDPFDIERSFSSFFSAVWCQVKEEVDA